MSEWQRGIDFESFAGCARGFGNELAAQEEAAGEEIGFSGLRSEAVLCGKGVARIVVALDVGIAKTQHILRIDVGAFDCQVGLFKEWESLRRPAHAKESHAVHFNGL